MSDEDAIVFVVITMGLFFLTLMSVSFMLYMGAI